MYTAPSSEPHKTKSPLSVTNGFTIVCLFLSPLYLHTCGTRGHGHHRPTSRWVEVPQPLCAFATFAAKA